jgi:hypothetical protein
LFDVTGGTLVAANGASFTFTSGNGGVLMGAHAVLLQAVSTNSNGQPVTLKFAGHYCYSWAKGHVALKIGSKLQKADTNYALLMLTPI